MPDKLTYQTNATYDAYASTYANLNPSVDPIRDYLKRFMGMLNRPDAVVLDVGCGAGRDCAYFAGQGYRTVGLDRSGRLLDVAWQNLPGGRFLQGDMRALPFAPGVFDGLWVCASLLHLPKADAPSIMAELVCLLRPGGALYCGVKRGEGERWVVSPQLGDAARFFAFYALDELTALLVNAGFAIVHTVVDDVWINAFAHKPE